MARTGHVQELRRLASAHGVARVADNAGKDRVKGMVDALMAKCLPAADAAALESAWGAYRSTWPGWLAGVEAQPGEGEGVFRWRFKAGQMTYNCTTGDWASSDQPTLQALFRRFVAFVQGVLAPLKPQGTSCTLETSTRGRTAHVHAHVYFHLQKEFRAKDFSAFAFEGIRPHFEPNRARGRAFLGAVRMGHYYVVVPKIGTLFDWTDYHPFQDYAVEGWWLDNWLKAGKLTRDTYLGIAARVTVGFQRRLTDVRAAERYEKEAAVRQHVDAELQALGDMQPAKEFPEIELFVEYFRSGEHRRRPILAIVGGTNLGKSLLAIQVLKKISKMVDVPGYLEITVEGNTVLDFSDYDHRVHSGVLLDGVGDALVLKQNREVLQGRPKVAKGGQSGTMIYSYPFTLCKRAVIATFDLAAANLDALAQDHWLSNPLNVITLHLTEKAYAENDESPARPSGSLLPIEGPPGAAPAKRQRARV